MEAWRRSSMEPKMRSTRWSPGLAAGLPRRASPTSKSPRFPAASSDLSCGRLNKPDDKLVDAPSPALSFTRGLIALARLLARLCGGRLGRRAPARFHAIVQGAFAARRFVGSRDALVG